MCLATDPPRDVQPWVSVVYPVPWLIARASTVQLLCTHRAGIVQAPCRQCAGTVHATAWRTATANNCCAERYDSILKFGYKKQYAKIENSSPWRSATRCPALGFTSVQCRHGFVFAIKMLMHGYRKYECKCIARYKCKC